MLGLLVHLLALALYAALAPVAALVCILLLEGPRPLPRAGAYALGYVAALLGLAGVWASLAGRWAGPDLATLFSRLLEVRGAPSAGWLDLSVAIGLAMLLLAAWRWWRRARPAAALPSWLTAVEGTGPLRASGLGALLVVSNVDNVLAFLAAVSAIGGAGFGRGGALLAMALLVAVSASPVLLPLGVSIAVPAQSAGALAALQAWIGRVSRTAITVMLAALGGWLVARGLSGLLGLLG